GNHQHAGVRLGILVTALEGASGRIQSPFADLRMDLVPDLTPALQRRMQSVFLRVADGAVEGHPSVDLGMDVVATLAAQFPDALIGLVPAGLDFLHQPTLVVPAALVQTHAAAPGD